MLKRINYWLWAFALSSVVLFTACDEETEDLVEDLTGDFQTGWFGEGEDWTNMENDVSNIGSSTNPADLPSSVDLRNYFPPIGNQGQYGTCVAWACGYNLKTALEARTEQYSTSQLADPQFQFSSWDLFASIPDDQKGGNCNGTYFEAALDVMVARGVAQETEAPYGNMSGGDCTFGSTDFAVSNANQFKLENYRQIPIQTNEIKGYLAKGRPVVFGAKLGEAFMSWNSSDVLTSDNDEINGQHAYHAMIVAGYDDSRGPNGAFLVVNSWGEGWGDNGIIWVDYNFFEQFTFGAFVAKNKPSDSPVDDGGGGGNVDDDDVIDGNVDLLAWNLQDQGSNGDRSIIYNVFNVGSNAVSRTQDWGIAYVAFNADNLEDYEILLYDYYTDDFDSYANSNSVNNGSYDAVGESGPAYWSNWWNAVDIPGGTSVYTAVTGDDENLDGWSWGYQMPSSLNGRYYLVLVADAYDVVQEYDESNNFYYGVTETGYVEIQNGVITNVVGKNGGVIGELQAQAPTQRGQASPSPTARTPQNVNAYTPAEFRKVLNYHRDTGELDRRVAKYRARMAAAHSVRRPAR